MAIMLQDKVAVVTGAGRGIGRGVAMLMAQEGAKVVVVDLGVNVDGSGLRNLTNHPDSDRGAAWSPDGKWIAFTSNRDGDPEIYIASVDGSQLTQVTNNKIIDV